MPVGGIKEKILAAVARGIKRVAIPKQNAKDLEEIPAELLAKIKVIPVSRFEEIIPLAFGKETLKAKKAAGNPKKERQATTKSKASAREPRKSSSASTRPVAAQV